MAVLPLLWLGVGKDMVSLGVGLPLLFLLNGGVTTAIELCINNLQIEIAHEHHQAHYFGIVKPCYKSTHKRLDRQHWLDINLN